MPSPAVKRAAATLSPILPRQSAPHRNTDRPGLYAMQSAPWYCSILHDGILTAGILALSFFLKWLLCKKHK